MADWTQMPFGVVSGVDRGMGALDTGGYHQTGRGSFGVNVGRPIVTGLCSVVVGEQCALPKLLWEGLVG